MFKLTQTKKCFTIVFYC